MSSWLTASERATKGETCAEQMTSSFQAHNDVMQFLSQARAMRSALVNRFYCAVCASVYGCNVYSFFTSKPLLHLVISRPKKKVGWVAFMAQHHHVCQTQTGLHVFKITHEMFVWSRAHHVIHVTQEDRIF